jgi:hypothetical protein
MLRWIRKDLGMPRYLGKEETRNTGGHSETFSNEEITNTELLNHAHGLINKLQTAKVFSDRSLNPKNPKER